MTQQDKTRRKPKTVYTIQCSDANSHTSQRWNFSNRKAAETALKRLSAHPTATCWPIVEQEVWSNAPVSDTFSTTLSLDGAVQETAGPFPNMSNSSEPQMRYEHYVSGQLTYIGPAGSKRQATEQAKQALDYLIDRNLLPQTPAERRRLVEQYHGVPWWMEKPPATPEPGDGTAMHGLLICPDCSRFLDEAMVDEEDVYNCPGDNPGCRCKNLPAEETKHRIINSLKHRMLEEHQLLDAARELQGHTTDSQYLQALAQQTLDTDESIHNFLASQQLESLQQSIRDAAEDRAEATASIKACLTSGTDPLKVLESKRETGGHHWKVLNNRYVTMLLRRTDSAGAADWIKQHVRCAEVVPDKERIHYQQPSGRALVMWEKADSESYIERVTKRE